MDVSKRSPPVFSEKSISIERAKICAIDDILAKNGALKLKELFLEMRRFQVFGVVLNFP